MTIIGNNITISLKDGKDIVKDFNFVLNDNDKLALIGEEGNGKSSLIKFIYDNSLIDEYCFYSGSVNISKEEIGYIPQSINSYYLDKTVEEYFLTEDGSFEINYEIYSKIYEIEKLLDKFKLDKSILINDIKVSSLSGGEKIKIQLIKILINRPKLYLFDEPTNDLDIETLEWLEDFINKCSKPIIYISHDETLLSNTANMILHLEQIKNKSDCRHTIMKIDYDTYVENRINSINKQTQVARSEKREFKKKEDKLKQVMNIVHHKQNTISRSDPFGAAILKRKMKSLKVQERRLNNKELTEMPDVEEGINFFFEDVFIPNTKVILDLKLDTLSINNKVLSNNINLNIIGNKKICIIGNNGCGKSTLIKEIYNLLKEREDISVGYMPQNYDDILDNYEYVLDFICDTKDKDTITKVRMNLGNMKFTKEEMIGKIKDLSSGTKAKLILMKLVMNKYNVLILDEPTRNVSPLSNPIIRQVLKNYKGTIISVSHDRKYINEVVDDIYILNSNNLEYIKTD